MGRKEFINQLELYVNDLYQKQLSRCNVDGKIISRNRSIISDFINSFKQTDENREEILIDESFKPVKVEIKCDILSCEYNDGSGNFSNCINKKSIFINKLHRCQTYEKQKQVLT